MHFNLPNTLTWIRIIVIPLVVVAFFMPFAWARPAAAWLFVIAGVTDYFDGYLARKLNQTSSFGAFLDPVADKLMVSTALVLLVQAEPSVMLAVIAAIIIGREITVSALREWMAEVGERAHVAVSYFGKLKTTAQIVGISMMLYRYDLFGLPIYDAGYICLMGAAVLTIWSMADYLRAAWPILTTRE
jgi:CDP-diacylglycerol--glycerol-3-phosphate 3-phosphatidyltransferase